MSARLRSSALEQDAAALYEASTAFIRIYQFRDRDHALAFGLTVVQAYTLDLLLASDGASLTALAQGLRLDKSTTSRVISGMTKHGLVAWSRPAHDRRAMQIVATTDGKRRYERLRRALVRDNARLFASYTPAARRAVIKALRQLADRALLSHRPAGAQDRTPQGQKI